jgi:hypothetical protein
MFSLQPVILAFHFGNLFAGLTLSRAGSLPQESALFHGNAIPCGSEPAREGVLKNTTGLKSGTKKNANPKVGVFREALTDYSGLRRPKPGR